MTHSSKDAHLLSGAYVLHALDSEERASVEAAMRDSEELRSEIAELSDTAVELGRAVAAAAPPTALRARVLALAADTPQLAHEPEPAPEAPRPVGRAERTAQRRWFLRPAVLGAAAAAAAVLFVGSLGVERLLPPPNSHSVPQQLMSLETASDVQKTQADVAGGGTAKVYSSASQADSAIVLDGVEQPSGGRVLQVWRLSGGTATSLGFYTSSDSGYVLSGHALATGDRIAVTVEPAGGSAKPTTKPLVALGA